jgi:hypothetical protein
LKNKRWERDYDSYCNKHELEILFSLLRVEDEELFEICIDTLRSFKNLENKRMIRDNPYIIERINEFIPKSGAAVKKIFEDFLLNIKK